MSDMSRLYSSLLYYLTCFETSEDENVLRDSIENAYATLGWQGRPVDFKIACKGGLGF